MSQWRQLKDSKCPGCGRPLVQHLFNHRLGREETVEDYTAWSMECPAQQAIALGQDMWHRENKSAVESFNKGHGPDPRMGLFWLAQGDGEALPQPEK